MTNISDLFELRVGPEADSDAWGTGVAQTHKVMGVTDFSLTPLVESQQIKDRKGSIAPGYESVPLRIHGEANLSGIVNYEYFPLWLDGLFGAATPAADTDIYTYAYTGPTTAHPTPRKYTMAWGNANDVDSVKSLTSATIRDLQISGATGEPITYTANFIGYSVDTDTFDSAAEANSTITTTRGCDFALAIDPSSDAAGTTSITTTWMDFDLNINSNRAPFWHLGSLQATNAREARWDVSLRLGMELNTTSAAYLDSILTTTTTTFERVVKVTATNGSNQFIFTVNGVALEAPQLYQDNDGVTTVSLMLTGQFNSVLSTYLTMSVVNTVSVMP